MWEGRKNDDEEARLKMPEMAIRILALILTSNFIKEGNKKIAIPDFRSQWIGFRILFHAEEGK